MKCYENILKIIWKFLCTLNIGSAYIVFFWFQALELCTCRLNYLRLILKKLDIFKCLNFSIYFPFPLLSYLKCFYFLKFSYRKEKNKRKMRRLFQWISKTMQTEGFTLFWKEVTKVHEAMFFVCISIYITKFYSIYYTLW